MRGRLLGGGRVLCDPAARREGAPWEKESGVADVTTKILLDESRMPTQWYNLVPDLPSPPPPPLHPGTLQPVGPDDLAPLFPMDLILQEVTGDRFVDIPGE